MKRQKKKKKELYIIGYSSLSKGYKVYNIDSGIILISRDVKLDEDACWIWETSQVDRYLVLPSLEIENEGQDEDVDNEFVLRGTTFI